MGEHRDTDHGHTSDASEKKIVEIDLAALCIGIEKGPRRSAEDMGFGKGE